MDQGERKSDELARRRAEEYEMQLFGLHSRTVFAAIHQKILENVDTRCHKMWESIEKKYNPEAKQKELLKNNIKQLRKTYRHNMKPHFKTIENTVRKFICVPDNVLLEEDKCQATQYSNEEIQKLEKKLEHLQQEAKRVTTFHAALKEEVATVERIRESEKLAIKLCNITDKGLSAKKLKSKNVKAIEKITSLTESLNSLQPQTQKEIYNPRLNETDLEQVFLD
ncbi:protein MIS12 homolog [Copidosoma floridanum]|uniref:protein MIS12 homolog n=1 Tax=Copidosoma floridanum TaxID=29053 RepID=UPI0006C9E16F|nr:protein MIS12 homolog [Copidosoma floridanum]